MFGMPNYYQVVVLLLLFAFLKDLDNSYIENFPLNTLGVIPTEVKIRDRC